MITNNQVKDKRLTPTPKTVGVRSRSNRGFTIVESLVSISILVLAVTGATSAIQTGISSYIFSKDQIIAFYLAQEGFEQVRNIRDENGLKNLPWLRGISEIPNDPCFFGRACRVDAINNSLTRCSSPGNCPVLRQNASTGFFGYNSSWPTTIFRREIILTQINTNEVSILVTVNWSKGVVSRQFRARENILNWQ
jgi:prepilin-type N-terminal cleavage/methylation domain-containing protein